MVISCADFIASQDCARLSLGLMFGELHPLQTAVAQMAGLRPIENMTPDLERRLAVQRGIETEVCKPKDTAPATRS